MELTKEQLQSKALNKYLEQIVMFLAINGRLLSEKNNKNKYNKYSDWKSIQNMSVLLEILFNNFTKYEANLKKLKFKALYDKSYGIKLEDECNKNVIYDYFDGVADLEAQKVIFVGNAEKRIQEDYLRILRFFRFSCRYANQLDAQALVACIANKDKLPLLSGERIKSELDLLLPLAGSADILYTMFAVGVLEQILPINNYNKNLRKIIIFL